MYRKNSWFCKDLPKYLNPNLYLGEISPYAKLNESVVEDMSKRMKYSKDTIHVALSEPENNQIQVAYRLIIDNLQIDPNLLANPSEKSFLASKKSIVESLGNLVSA